MGEMKVGCQLIIFGREAIANDLPGVLETLGDAGYAGAETGDLSGQISASELKQLLTSLGLELVGTHVGFDALHTEVDRLADYLVEAGGNYLVSSGVGDRSKGLAVYEEAAPVMNEAGRKLGERGLTFCYHNHSWEFEKFDGQPALLRLYELTDPEVVKLCVDTYWVHHGGEDAADFVARYARRVAILHLKDMKDETFAEVGEGVLDFAGILKAVEGQAVEWAVVEQDRTQRTPEESVRMSRRYLRDWLGV